MEKKDAPGERLIILAGAWRRSGISMKRKVPATGHETTDTDPVLATSKDDYSLEKYVLSHDHYH